MTEKWNKLEQILRTDYGNTAGIVIRRDGHTLYENYFLGNGPSDAMHVFSVTKSVCSALIGIAVGQGYIRNVEQPVLDFFPDYAPDPGNETIGLVTIRDLLTMTAPFRYETEPYEEFFGSGDWMRFALGLLGGVEKPGRFRYSPIIGAHLLAGVLARATGRFVLEFAAESLFSPLGIEIPATVTLRGEEEFMAWYAKPRYEPSWTVDPQGIHPASWGLCLTPRSMAKIGQLYLDGGLWDGRQILPADWVRESTAVHSRWEKEGLGYGYLWWVPEDGIYAALGDGGNVIYGNRALGLVVAIACRFEPAARDRIGLIRDEIEPLLV